MVNSCNSRSPILLDTPEGASANPVIEINDSGGHSRHHVRRRRHDSTEDVIIADSPKRARMDVPVIDLTSDNEEDYPTTENDTERLIISMREQVQNSTRRLAELRARREHVMSLLPDDARRRIRRAMSLRQRFTLNHPRYQVEDHEDRNGDPRAESSRNQPMTNRHGEDGVPPIVVEDDDSHGQSSLFDRHDGFSRPSCSRVNPSRVFLPDNVPESSRPAFPPAGNRSERTRVLTHNNTPTQDPDVMENERLSSGHFRDTFHPVRTSRTRQTQRRRQHLRDCLAYLSPLSRSTSNPQANSDESLAGTVQAAEYQSTSSSINQTLPNFIPEIEQDRLLSPRRLTSRGLSPFEQPLQPYIPDLLLPAVLSIWGPDSRLRHLGDPDEEREDYEALWNLTERLGQVKPKGLSKADMEEIPAFRYSAASKDSSNGSCIVCMMDYSNREKLRRLPCNHDFHAKCIDRWLKNNRSCPVCRKDVISK